MSRLAALQSVRRTRQRGAAALFAAVGLLGVLIAAAFAIDLAQIYIAKRDLQNIANLTALDVARSSGGCLAPDLDRQFTANATGIASLTRNGGQGEWLVANQVTLGRAVRDGAGLRSFQAVAPDDQGAAYAFEVALQRPVPDLIMPLPGFEIGATSMRARAVAVMAPAASYNVGSYLADVGAEEDALLDELFSALLGGPVDLSLLSYRALLNTSVELAEVAQQLGGSTLEQLLTDPISLPGLLVGIADALFDAGEGAAAAAVDTLAGAAPNDNVILGDFIGTPQEVVAGTGNAGINTLELVRAAALQIGDPVLELTPDITIPGVATLTGTVSLGQPATLGVGPALQDGATALTSATNTQGVIETQAQVLPGLGIVQANLRIAVADAQADLREIRCADRSRPQHEVDLDVTTSVVRLVVDNPPASPLIDLGLTAICWTGSVDIAPPESRVLSFTGPFDPNDPDTLERNTQTVGSPPGASLGSAISNLLVDSPPYVCGPVGGPIINGLVQPVLAQLGVQLAPALQAIVDPFLLPLLQAIGGNIGGADVTMRDLQMSAPALIETN